MHKAKPAILSCAILIVLVCLAFPAAVLAAGNAVYLQTDGTGTTGAQSDPVGSFSAAKALISDGDNIAFIGGSLDLVVPNIGPEETWSLAEYGNSKFIVDSSFTNLNFTPPGAIYVWNGSLSLSDIIIENDSAILDSTSRGIFTVDGGTLTLGEGTVLINPHGPAITVWGSGLEPTNLVINSNVNIMGNIVVSSPTYSTIKIAGPLSNPIDILLPASYVSAGVVTNITAAEGYTLTAEDVAKLNLVNENYHFELLKNGQVIVAEDVPTVSLTESLDFAFLRAGYTTPPAAQTATVTNISDGAVTLIQPESTDHFTVGALSATELAPGAAATFEVTPKESLSPGSYTDTITVNSTGGGVAPACSARVDVCYTFECAVTGLTDELPASTDSSPYFKGFGILNAVRDGGVFYTDPAAYLTAEGERYQDIGLHVFDPKPGYKLSWSIDQYAAGNDETVLNHWDVSPGSLNPCYNYKATLTVSYDDAYTTVTTGSVNAAPGATAQVPVTITGNTGFSAFAFTIGYDAGALELTDITKTPSGEGGILTSAAGAFIGNIAGNTVTWDDLYNTTAVEGTLFTLTFHVKETVAGHVYPITVNTQGSQVICDENAEVVPALFLPGAVTVAESGELTPPTLIADTTENTVGQGVEITFSDDGDWRSAISGITVNTTDVPTGQYTVSPGKITIDAGVFTEPGDYTVKVTATGYSNATVTQRMEAAIAEDPKYTVTPVEDGSAYEAGEMEGISIMTVNPGVSGLTYFAAQITPVTAHEGKEVAVFTHLRDGSMLSLNITKADFDLVNRAQAGFNVQAGDIVKVFIMDDLTNDLDFNPTLLQ